MSIETIHLRKLLSLFYLSHNIRISKLREDIRSEIQKEHGGNSGGGDFHMPFWTDAKNHVARHVDLREQVEFRIASNRRRERLYPQLADGFLGWWDDRRRWRNEAFEFLPDNVYARHAIPELNATVKVENLLALRVGETNNRIIYPYFSEEPILPDEGSRLGLWLLIQALPDYAHEDMRILDVLRGASFGVVDRPLLGNEQDIFLQRYGRLLAEWRELWGEYEE